jgi:hypothetical protein
MVALVCCAGLFVGGAGCDPWENAATELRALQNMNAKPKSLFIGVFLRCFLIPAITTSHERPQARMKVVRQSLP